MLSREDNHLTKNNPVASVVKAAIQILKLPVKRRTPRLSCMTAPILESVLNSRSKSPCDWGETERLAAWKVMQCDAWLFVQQMSIDDGSHATIRPFIVLRQKGIAPRITL